MDETLRHEPDRRRFVLARGGAEAVLRYVDEGSGVVDFRSTHVPPEHRGQGVGSLLVAQALEHARRAGWRIRPSCSFVQAFVDEHPEVRDLVAPD